MTKRRWLILMTVGFAMMIVAMIVVALVIADKEDFGGLVGPAFLPVITSGVIAGGLLMLIGSLMIPERKTWQGIVLILWSLIAVTSPLFGFMFLLPWGLLAISAPVVIWSLATMLRQAPARSAK
jgi:hypothetical protein